MERNKSMERILSEEEKYLSLKLGMNISKVEKVLEQKVILERHTLRPDAKGFYYANDTIGTYLSFTKDKILDFISFGAPFSIAVDGIAIGMDMNEVEKIKGLPERKENWENFPEQEEWFYSTKDTFYLFIENKVYDITLYKFWDSYDEKIKYSKNYLTQEDIEVLTNSVGNNDEQLEQLNSFTFKCGTSEINTGSK